MSEPSYPDLLKQLIAGEDLAHEQTHWAFGQLMEGKFTEAQIGALLAALAAKGETVEEISGAARAMREHVVHIDSGDIDVIDTCGTGGTGISTFNISTAVSFVLAGAGVTVAKHGNRTSTRVSGSANV
ncbi:MAG: anthranilate phosphoribosyltransferase, partial [Planctomycetota bacterium]